MERADDVVEICRYIKAQTLIPVRLNTNGLVKLINPDFKINRLNNFDSVSISLNADNAVDYQKLTQSKFGETSFDSMLSFAKETKQYTKVYFSVVDVDGFNLEKCKEISRELGIDLRIRAFGM